MDIIGHPPHNEARSPASFLFHIRKGSRLLAAKCLSEGHAKVNGRAELNSGQPAFLNLLYVLREGLLKLGIQAIFISLNQHIFKTFLW